MSDYNKRLKDVITYVPGVLKFGTILDLAQNNQLRIRDADISSFVEEMLEGFYKRELLLKKSSSKPNVPKPPMSRFGI